MQLAHHLRRFTFFLGCVLAMPQALAGRAGAQESQPVFARDFPVVKKTQRDLMWTGARKHFARAAEQAQAAKKAKSNKGKKGQRARRVLPDDDLSAARREALRLAMAPEQVAGMPPPNTRVNNPTGDAVDAGQAEQSIAMLGNFGLDAWNDGQGFVAGPHTQGVAYTTDGGASWVDVGDPPVAGATGGSIGAWVSDPVVAVNEKTGKFYYCGLIDGVGATTNGIAVVPATFPGGVFTWGTPHVVLLGSNATDFYDKEWMVADSLNGNLYLTYTRFVVGGNSIEFRRSTDDGVSWSGPITLSSPAASGFVQGSRPAVGPGGQVYTIWREIGPIDVDFVRSRTSLNQGGSFGVENTPVTLYDNFGTGAPGFNRERSVFNPAPAVDRSTGPNRGRFYVTWNESVNWYNDPLGGGGNKSSVENDNFYARANPFTPGQILRGAFSSSSDVDLFSFSATAGTSYIFWCDSVPRPLYTMRVICNADTLTRLAFAGDILAPAGANGFIVWTAPTTGTYYLRMSYVSGGASGGYRIQTGINTPGPERGRDQRDVFVGYSDDGGTTWSSPARINDDPALYDDWLPDVAVTSEGYAYVMWYDWRDAIANCGGNSHIYASRSTNGGASWSPGQRVTSAPTMWTLAQSNIAPNQGDYNGLYGGDQLVFSWADGRSGNVDVWSAIAHIGYQLGCRSDSTVDRGKTANFVLPITNPDVLFDQSVTYSLSANRNWPGLPIAGGVVVAEGSTSGVPFTFTIPDTAKAGAVRLCLRAQQANGAKPDSCCFLFNVRDLVGVETPGAQFALHRAVPNPTAGDLTVFFSLPDASPATIELIDINGRRIMRREVGSLGAGLHSLSLRSETRHLPNGVYALRLSRAGRQLMTKVSVLH